MLFVKFENVNYYKTDVKTFKEQKYEDLEKKYIFWRLKSLESHEDE